MTTLLKRAPRSDVADPRPARVDAKAEVQRAEYLCGRYGVPDAKVAQVLAGMDRVTQTFLALEMRDMQRASYAADYDPFEGI